MKFIIPMVVVFSFAVCSCSDNPVISHEYGQGDDYEIYRVILADNTDLSSTRMILGDSTGTSITGSDLDSIRIANFSERLSGLQDETITNFILTNKDRSKIKYISGVDHLVLSSDYHDSSNENTVQVGLSRVGYNSSRTQAVVELGETWAPLVGSGTLFLLLKENGKWVIKGRCMTWIS